MKQRSAFGSLGWLWAAPVTAALVAGCGSSSSGSTTTTHQIAGGTSSSGGDGGGGAGGSSSTSSSGTGTSPVFVCPMGSTWGTGTKLAVSTAGDDQLAAVTPDELTLAWVTGAEGSAVVHYVDRADTASAFGAEKILAAPMAGGLAFDRTALAPGGLRIGVLHADRQSFTEYSRNTRNDAFTEVGAGTFAALNDIGAAFTDGSKFGEPMIDSNDRAMIFSIYGGASANTVWIGARVLSGDSWQASYASMAPELQAQNGKRRRPTGLSSDVLTLFYWDEVTSVERVAYRNGPVAEFTTFADIGAQAGAGPNLACDALYYQATGTAGLDLFRAPRN